MTVNTVMIVEDTPDSAAVLEYVFGLEQVTVITAADGETALAHLGELVPDLILIDLRLPDINGWTLAQTILENPAIQQVPLIAMTAYDTPGLERKALEAGFWAYLAKPIRPETILNVLSTVANAN
ncbi:MAG: response regulator [Chloroflexi bacterium]|nr:response regulator [Chloroflexota bacterium]